MGEVERLSVRLRHLRETGNVTQTELARAFKVHRKTISNWEHDKTTPQARHLRKLVRALRAVEGGSNGRVV